MDQNTPDPDRIRTIMRDLRMKYIKSPRDEKLQEIFQWLVGRGSLRQMPNQIANGARLAEGRAVAVSGYSGEGKTTAIGRIFANNPNLPDFGQPSCKVVCVTTPAPCTLKTLGRAILRALGYPLNADRKEHEIWEMVHARLAQMGTQIIFIDELQNVTSIAKKDEATRIRDTLKSLMNSPEHPVCLMFSGLPEIERFLTEDEQVARRTRFVKFETINESNAAVIKAIIKSYTNVAALAVTFGDKLAERLIHASNGRFGVIIEMTLEAIEIALEAGATELTREHFATAYVWRTGNAAPANPFVADNWRAINSRRVHLRDVFDGHEDQEAQATKKTSRRRR
ncbi:TniB protein [Rhodoblastus acidophilus]|uniref:TniB protein n=1 Tax=Rhodoblastus acidophilus TaxID=1074 RepID=A0A212RH18_RHOAC|nr:TniB family NTP-binding protein [Rhodoblastus acidophilus]SNB71706.1 TniB protein [Rhodoblastus acidophilus]